VKKLFVATAVFFLLMTTATASTAPPLKKPEVTAADSFMKKMGAYAVAQNSKMLCSMFSSEFLLVYVGGGQKLCAQYVQDAWRTTPPPSSFRIMRTVLFQGKVRAVVETQEQDATSGKWHSWLYVLIKERGSLKLLDMIDNGPIKNKAP